MLALIQSMLALIQSMLCSK